MGTAGPDRGEPGLLVFVEAAGRDSSQQVISRVFGTAGRA